MYIKKKITDYDRGGLILAHVMCRMRLVETEQEHQYFYLENYKAKIY